MSERCYDCGDRIHPDDVCPRTVQTAVVQDGLWGLACYRIASRVPLCPDCAAVRDAELRRRQAVINVLMWLGIAFFGSCVLLSVLVCGFVGLRA